MQSALPVSDQKSPPVKRVKRDDKSENGSQDGVSFDGFKVVKVLLNDSHSKRIHVHGMLLECSVDMSI